MRVRNHVKSQRILSNAHRVPSIQNEALLCNQPIPISRGRRTTGRFLPVLVTLTAACLTVAAPARAEIGQTAAHYASALMRDFGWTLQQAIGALASLGHESGLQGIEQFGGGPGFGVAQWTGPRRQAFLAWSARAHLEPHSEAANLGFLLTELHTDYAHVAQHMRGARTMSDAVITFAREYEGALAPGAITAMESRQKWATELSKVMAYSDLTATVPSPVKQALRQQRPNVLVTRMSAPAKTRTAAR
jgi:hypothetical protein